MTPLELQVTFTLSPQTPEPQTDGLARLFHRLHTWWAMEYNRRAGHCGQLFHSRYHSSPMEENHY